MVHSTDTIALLVQANMAASEEDKLPDDEVIAQLAYVHICVSHPFTDFMF